MGERSDARRTPRHPTLLHGGRRVSRPGAPVRRRGRVRRAVRP
ncbi:hypothetical protein HMPREF0569_0215 [Micrococcus luteus SK58]|nr:hypothetical protein HMPREF0569_0215 [Micrococcus luteus SK58]